MAQRLKKFYFENIVPKLLEQFQYKNKLQVPRVEKIVINRGLGTASQNAKILDSCLKELTIIAGQKGVITRSKKAIAGLNFDQICLLGFQLRYEANECMVF